MCFSEYFINALNIKVNICITNPWVSKVLYLKDNSTLKRHLCTWAYMVIYFVDEYGCICRRRLHLCFCFSQCDNMFFAVCNFPVSKNKLSVPPPPTPAASLSQLHIPKSPFHGGLYLHPSWVLIPLCSLFALLFFLHLASLTGRWGIDRAVPQCQIWNRGSSPPCFHWPIIPFPTGLKGPSVTDNLPVREGETEEMREGVLSLSVPIVITCFFCYRFLMSRVLLIPLLRTFFLIFIPLHHTLSYPFPPAIQRQQWPESGPLNWDQGFFQYFYIPRES